MKEIWWPPYRIFFSVEQIPWLLQHLSMIREGYWPSEHRESGYEYIGGHQAGGRKSAYFETPVAIAAELEHRLESCGLDGMMLEFYAVADYSDDVAFENKLALYTGTTARQVHERIRNARYYCCGWKRKRVSYPRYCTQRRSYDSKKLRPVKA